MKRNLVILVSDYPNPHGEPFLENELKIISNDFHKIYIIPKLFQKRIREDSNHFSNNLFLPDNAIVVPLSPIKNGLFSKLKYLFTLKFIKEILKVVVKHKVKLSFSIIRLVLYYLESATLIEGNLLKLIMSYNLDRNETIYYSYWCDEGTLALSSLKRKKRINYFVTRLHGWDVYFERHKQRFLPFREVIFNNATFVFPISNNARSYIIERKLIFNTEKIITSRLGVNELKPHNRILKNNNEIYLLTISHINKVKRLDRLIDALCQINDFNVVWNHIGWGYPELELEFKKQINQNLLKKRNIKVNLLGEFTKNQVANFLQQNRTDVLINCSENEGIPVSMMEAFSAGIPAIAFDVGGIPEIISNGKSGLLLKNDLGNHSQQLIEAITFFLKMPIDEYLVFSKHAREDWELKYNINTNYKYFSNILLKI